MPRRLTLEEAMRIGESLPPIGLIGKPPVTRDQWAQLSRWRRLVAWFQLRQPLTDDD